MRPENGMTAQLAQLGDYTHLIRNLVARDLKLKYKGSALGFLWSLANPALMLAVYTFAFRYVLAVPIEHFPVYFAIGYLPWIFLTGAVATGTTCIVENGTLLNKVYFPRMALPYSVVLSHAVQFVLAFVALLPFLVIMGLRISPEILLLPWLVVVQLIFILGLTQAAASSHVFFRDTRHFVEILLTVWFWLTPIVYAPEMVPERLRPVLDWNPMSATITAYRAILLDGALPELGTLLQVHAWAGVAFLLGSSIFARSHQRFPELV